MQKLQLVNPILPLMESLPGGITVGNQLTLIGNTHLNANRFSIKLQCRPNVSPRTDVTLHVSPDSNRNVYYSLAKLPDLLLIVFDRQSVFYMSHSMPNDCITHFAIDGDVLLNEVHLSTSLLSTPYAGAPPYPGTAPPYPGIPPTYSSVPMSGVPYPTQPGFTPYVQPNQNEEVHLEILLEAGVGAGVVGAVLSAKSLKPESCGHKS